jgi:hypothetical protein
MTSESRHASLARPRSGPVPTVAGFESDVNADINVTPIGLRLSEAYAAALPRAFPVSTVQRRSTGAAEVDDRAFPATGKRGALLGSNAPREWLSHGHASATYTVVMGTVREAVGVLGQAWLGLNANYRALKVLSVNGNSIAPISLNRGRPIPSRGLPGGWLLRHCVQKQRRRRLRRHFRWRGPGGLVALPHRVAHRSTGGWG